MFAAMASCNDDEPEVENSDLYGTWECINAEVTDITSPGLDLPDEVMSIFASSVVQSLEGSTTFINQSNVKVKGSVITFNESGIKWTILSLNDNKMTVKYNTDSSYQGISIKMTVRAEFRKR